MVSRALFTPAITPEMDLDLPGFLGLLNSIPSKDLLENGGYEEARRVASDPFVKGCQKQLAVAVCKDPIQVERGEDTRLGKKFAAMIEDAVNRVDWEILTPQILRAKLIGWATMQLYLAAKGEYITLNTDLMDVGNGEKWQCPGIGTLDQQWIDFTLYGNPRYRTWQDLPYGMVLPWEKHWIIRYEPYYEFDYDGEGEWLALRWLLKFWRANTVGWVTSNELNGAIPVVRYPSGLGKDSPEAQDAYRIAQELKQGKGVAASADTGIELLQTGRSSAGDFQAFARESRELVSILLLGQVGSASAIDGTGAQSAEHMEVAGWFSRAISDWICSSFNQQVIPKLQRLNPQFAGVKPPKIWRRVQKKDDPEKVARTWQIMKEVGYRPSATLVQSEFGDGYMDLQPPLDPNAPQPKPTLASQFFANDLPVVIDYINNAKSSGKSWESAIAFLSDLTGRSVEECERWLPRYTLDEVTPTETTVTPDPMAPDAVPLTTVDNA